MALGPGTYFPRHPDDDVEADSLTGSTFEADDPDYQVGDVIDTDDGGALLVTGDSGDREDPEGGFWDNLADTDDTGTLNELDSIAVELCDLFEVDKEARKKRDEQYADGLSRTGFAANDDAPGGAQFTGASRVQHPMIGKASVDFASHAMKELFPPDGPAKDKVVGEVTNDKLARARRKTRHLNWQLTEQMPEFRPVLEQILSQVPAGGAQYLKVYWDRRLKRSAVEPVWIDNLFLPDTAASFLAARRRIIRQVVTTDDYQDKVDTGEWVDIDNRPASMGVAPEESRAEQATAKIEGKDQDPQNRDGAREFLECYVWLDRDDPAKIEDLTLCPYVVTVDTVARRIVSMYRNWSPQLAEDQGVYEELMHLVEWPFIPWRGAYPIGIYHLIGQLAIAATGALRAVLDSAHINNSPGMLKLKGLLRGGQNQNIQPTGINELEASVNIDDIRKLAMALPFNPPSVVLYHLLGWLTDQAEGVVRTALEETDAASANMPVGTTLARIEQGMIVFSAIHARLHAAMGQTLKILHRLNRDYLEHEVIHPETGEVLAEPEDYQGPMDVVPVSDPNIFSEAQRFAQVQAIAQRATGNPLYNQMAVELRILETLKIPAPKELLQNPPDAEPQDPVSENVALALGRPASAFPNQNHEAHLRVHLMFALDPTMGMSMLVGPGMVAGMMQHLKEHLVLLYGRLMADVVQRATRGQPVSQLMDSDPRTANSLARAFSAAASYVHGEENKNLFLQLKRATDMYMQFQQQVMQAMMPPDPALAAAQVQAKEVERRTADDQAKHQIEGARLQLDAQESQARTQETQAKVEGQNAKTQVDAQRIQLDRQQTAAELQKAAVEAGIKRMAEDRMRDELAQKERLAKFEVWAKRMMNREDNATALQIADMEVQSAEKTALSTGHGINP